MTVALRALLKFLLGLLAAWICGLADIPRRIPSPARMATKSDIILAPPV